MPRVHEIVYIFVSLKAGLIRKTSVSEKSIKFRHILIIREINLDSIYSIFPTKINTRKFSFHEYHKIFNSFAVSGNHCYVITLLLLQDAFDSTCYIQ